MIPEHASHMVRRKRHCCRRALYTKKVRREQIRELCFSYQKNIKLKIRESLLCLTKKQKKRESLLFLTKKQKKQ